MPPARKTPPSARPQAATTGSHAATRRRRRSAPAPEPAAGRPTLTPEAWIDAATTVLVDRGIDHVRVDVLAGELGVTRGSFYWHFRDREELLRRVLQAWHERATEQLTARLASARSDPREALHDVTTLPFRGRSAARAARIELAIRAWARRDAVARAALDEADASRLDYHRTLFEATGFAPDEAKARAFLLYSYEVAESLLHRQGSSEEREARRRLVERLIQQPLAA